MLRKTIGKLRRQPKHVRDGVAFWVASGFVCIVSVLWLFNNPIRFAEVFVDTSEGPQKSFFEEMAQQVAAVKEAVPNSEPNTATPANTEPQNSSVDGQESLDTLLNSFREKSQARLAASSTNATSSSSASTTEPVASESEASNQTSTEPKPVRIISVDNTATSTVNQ